MYAYLIFLVTIIAIVTWHGPELKSCHISCRCNYNAIRSIQPVSLTATLDHWSKTSDFLVSCLLNKKYESTVHEIFVSLVILLINFIIYSVQVCLWVVFNPFKLLIKISINSSWRINSIRDNVYCLVNKVTAIISTINKRHFWHR